eukprot:NODE_241_length_11910_cov_1.082381.p5 type:complete len:265 gc:universal NODE_241_length_11910_cov_1.082381:4886-4092(-)
MIQDILSSDEFYSFIGKSSGAVLVDFYTSWCGPCKAIQPHLESLVPKHPNVKFIKINIDNFKEIAEQYQIKSIPTFITFNNGKVVGTVSGANPPAIDQLLIKLSEISQVQSQPTKGPPGFLSLKPFVLKNQIEGLNVKNLGVLGILEGKGSLESDCDEQVIISLPFNATVKVHSLEISVKDIKKAPKSLKFYNNQQMTFEDVDDLPCVQDLTLNESDYKLEDKIYRAFVELKYVKFQRVPKLNVLLNNIDICRKQYWRRRCYGN